ncbi:ADP-ribosylglycohydrolase family protein [Microbacterium dauci]|uniref:ADP-ribosylglycohydrolase family protein n=1 Tax=Microbacterium dauci TaxID=3048008 RepID=A0ABT6ZB53_9MICO|nr:ADP-ribosylglycohydrolase family protein [Microbacterium sp. LX3-4]MDJ1113395.1 ADP-ribosylglycohydrolase family protein [Microbacterium sp. LX3-4]
MQKDVARLKQFVSQIADRGPATWQSRTRGLFLGLTLGDALGQPAKHDSPAVLVSGVTTQLAAWTADALLRRTTRYGLYPPQTPHGEWDFMDSMIRTSLERWLMARDGDSRHGEVPAFGWLSDVPALRNPRGNATSTERALRRGSASRSNSCRPMIRSTVVAVYAGAERFQRASPAQTARAARTIAAATHDHPDVLASAELLTFVAVHALRTDGDLNDVLQAATRISDAEPSHAAVIAEVLELARSDLSAAESLHSIAPDDSAASVLRGALFLSARYPSRELAEDALKAALRAPDPDGVAAVVGALIGATHGYEVFPTVQLSRLELGWVMDRLAIDLGEEVREDKVPAGGWKEAGSPWNEPWWDVKYPGI